jgi:predicted nucleotide-binding protein (sugar kinase/HSP70/actin superfamily)
MKQNKSEVVTEVVTEASAKKEFAKIIDKSYEANAFVVDYKTAKERKAHLAELGRKVPEGEKRSGEARVIIEGRPYWVAVNFGHVFKGTRLKVVYLKDEKGEIWRKSITPIKPEAK